MDICYLPIGRERKGMPILIVDLREGFQELGGLRGAEGSRDSSEEGTAAQTTTYTKHDDDCVVSIKN